MLNISNFLNTSHLSEEINFLQNLIIQNIASSIKSHPVISTVGVLTGVAATTSLIPKFVGKKLPPGPVNLPFVGGLWAVDLNGDFSEMKKKYGDLSSFYIGNQPVILVQSIEIARKLYIDRKDDFMPRSKPMFSFSDIMLGGHFDEMWKKQKKVIINLMRDILHVKIPTGMEFANDSFEKEIEKLNGKAIYPLDLLRKTLGQSTIYVFLSKHLDLDDPYLVNSIDIFSNYVDSGVDSVTCSKAFLPFGSHYYKDTIFAPHAYLSKLRDIHIDILNRKKSEMTPGEPKDWLEALYQSFSPKFSDEQIIDTYFTTSLDAMQALAVTLTRCIIRLLMNPEVQEECHKILDETVGENRPTLHNRKQLALIEGVFLETLRMHDILTVASPHSCYKDFKFMGYDIPKDSTIIIVPDPILFDENLFPEPHVFNPKRFLCKSGVGVSYKPTEYIPFGLGYRKCVGEQIARQQGFLLLANILHKYKLECDGEMPVFSRRRYYVDIRETPKFNVRFIKREKVN